MSRTFVLAGLVPAIHVLRTRLSFLSPRHACGDREKNSSTRKRAMDHFAQDPAPDALVGEGGTMPPPAVLLHPGGRGDNAVRHFREIGIGVVEAEDEAAG